MTTRSGRIYACGSSRFEELLQQYAVEFGKYCFQREISETRRYSTPSQFMAVRYTKKEYADYDDEMDHSYIIYRAYSLTHAVLLHMEHTGWDIITDYYDLAETLQDCARKYDHPPPNDTYYYRDSNGFRDNMYKYMCEHQVVIFSYLYDKIVRRYVYNDRSYSITLDNLSGVYFHEISSVVDEHGKYDSKMEGWTWC